MVSQLLNSITLKADLNTEKPIKQLKLPIRISHKLEQKLSKAQRFGKSGEQFASSVVLRIFNPLSGYKEEHNDWKTYITSQSKGADVKIYKDNGLIIAIEVKNWRQKKYAWGKDKAYKEIVTRFEGLGDCIKILFISFKKMLTEAALKMLADYHIFVFEVGQTFTKKDKHFPDFFYSIVKHLKEFITDITEKFAGFFSNSISILNSDLNCNNQYEIELKEINRVTNKVLNNTNKILDTELLDNELIELNKLIDTQIPNIINKNTDNVINNQLNQNKTNKNRLDNSYISSDSDSLSQLFSANNLSLISNSEHDSWLKDKINRFLATLS